MTAVADRIADGVFGMLAVAAVPLLIYGWWFYFKTARHHSGWRTGVSLVVLGLTTVCILLFPVAVALGPRPLGDNDASMGRIVAYYERWHRVILKALGGCFLLSFLGRGRLIPIMAAASLGVGFLWIMLTIT